MKYPTIISALVLTASLFIHGCDARVNEREAPSKDVRPGVEYSETRRTDEALLGPEYIAAEYPNKLVYTTAHDLDVAALRKDCRLRKGHFNECGSPCAEGELCVQVCAYTCEFR